jgi:hypothetical protein
VSDLRSIRHLKHHFGEQARAAFVSSALDAEKLRRIQQERWGFCPDDDQKLILSTHFVRINAAARLGWWDRVSDCVNDLEQDWHAYATDAKSTEIRIARIRATHIRYIEHINLFDHVILNYSEGKPEEMQRQLSNIIVSQDKIKKKRSKTPIFVVAASSGAGKGTLMEMLNLIGRDRIRVASKLAKREPKPQDRMDGMIALWRKDEDPEPQWPSWWTSSMVGIAKTGDFPSEYDMRWKFHNVEYAVASIEIIRNLEDGKPQIFISNMGQFERFKNRWSENIVFLYLHRLVTDKDNRDYQMEKWKDNPSQAEERIRERAIVHEDFIHNVADFNHVLLNTSYEEDLYDQMFHLISDYSRC